MMATRSIPPQEQRAWDFNGDMNVITGPRSLRDYDWILLNTSAGKDSQAMCETVVQQAREEDVAERLVMVHADLGRMEWAGTKELAAQHAAHYQVRFEVVRREGRTLLEEVEHRGMWPANRQRYCTSYYKRDAVNKLITRLTNETRDGWTGVKVPATWVCGVCGRGYLEDVYCQSHGPRVVPVSALAETLGPEWWRVAFGFDGPPQVTQGGEGYGRHYQVRLLNCMGLRADESPARAKRAPFVMDPTRSSGRRVVDNWLPLHAWTEQQVWEVIRTSGVPHHYAYDLGMRRLSCCFCIFAPEAALLLAGHHNRELLREYVAVEQKIEHTFRQDTSLVQIQAKLEAGHVPGPCPNWVM